MFYFHDFKDTLRQCISQPVINSTRRNSLCINWLKFKLVEWFTQTINSFWNSLFAVLSARILCLAHTLAPLNVRKQGEKDLGSLLLPHTQQLLPATHSKCPSEMSLAGGWDICFPSPVGTGTNCSCPPSFLDHAFKTFTHLFFSLLSLGKSPLDPSIPCRVVLQDQDKSSV